MNRTCALLLRPVALAAGVVGALIVDASASFAHVGGPAHGFADGARHPIGGPDHLLAMVAVGLVAAISLSGGEHTCRDLWLAPAAFLTGMVLGGALGLAGWSVPYVETLIMLSVIALGVAVAGALRGSGLWLLGSLALAGMAHGNAHGTEAPSASNPLLYVLGFVVVTTALHATGVFAGLGLRRVPTLRVGVGVAVAAAGAALLVS